MPLYANTSRTPFVCAENLADTLLGNRYGSLTASSTATGFSVDAVADGRRDRTWWQGADDGAGNTTAYRHTLTIDVGAGRTAGVGVVVLDRGHTLWGRTVAYRSSADGSTWTTVASSAVPALTTDSTWATGGSPLSGWCVTEEGLLYTLVPLTTARFHQVAITGAAGYVPVVTGLTIGAGVQLSQYPVSVDDRARGRTQSTAQSTTGWRASDTTYSWRRFTLKLGAIGAAEYDAVIDRYVQRAFSQNQPSFVVVDAGRYPERAGVFVVDATAYDAPITRVTRELTLPYVEHLASLTPPVLATADYVPPVLPPSPPPPPPASPPPPPPASPPPPPPAGHLFDTSFDGAAGVLPSPWVALVGTWSRNGAGQAYLSANGSGENVAVVDVGQSDGTISTVLDVVAGEPRVYFRTAAVNSLFFVYIDGSNTLQVYRITPGSYVSIGSVNSLAGILVDGVTLAIVLNGSSITLKLAGTTVLTLTDTYNVTATRHGIGQGGVSVARYGAFTVDA